MPTPRSRAARACARARAHRRGRRRASDARHPQALDGQPTSASPAGPGHHVGVLLTAALGRGPERGLPPGTEAIAVGWRCTRPGHPRGPHQMACRGLLDRTRLGPPGWAGPSDADSGHRSDAAHLRELGRVRRGAGAPPWQSAQTPGPSWVTVPLGSRSLLGHCSRFDTMCVCVRVCGVCVCVSE